MALSTAYRLQIENSMQLSVFLDHSWNGLTILASPCWYQMVLACCMQEDGNGTLS